MKKHYDIRVKGRVQGVWFRKFTKQEALSLGLCGKVRNERDGSVFIQAEGEEEMLNTFIEWCHHGPEKASVDEVIIEERPVVGYTAFLIEY